VLLIITVSIGLPIYVRPFYYMQIDDLDLPRETGYTKAEIRNAYDEMLDYLTLPGKEFSTGVFPYNAEGESHFQDCKVLFHLNAIVLLSSAAALIILKVLQKCKVFTPCRPFQRHYSFISGLGTLGIFALVGGLGSIDFDKTFVIFHRIFFPGKDNWIFDPAENGIILALPETFFLRCGILFISSMLLISLTLVLVSAKKSKPTEVTV
ncbi:MAG: TIGR01906 family membrane protein, partial [Oscillospiraceae bacterium]|nr:TIGR01906 family membrane protein [Oscillospiraceae bacterium]